MIHPVTALVRRFGKVNAVGVVTLVVGVVAYVTPESPVLTVALLVGMLALFATSESFQPADDGTELDDARTAYARGEISLAEFERRAELILDDRAEEIREVVEGVGGVGPETSAAIALAFESVDELRRAGDEDLQAIHGVGPSMSTAIREHVGRSTATASRTGGVGA